MSKKIKKIIGKGVLSILLVTTSFFYIGNICLIISFAEENTEVSTIDKQQEALEKLVLYDYYSTTINDKVHDGFLDRMGSLVSNSFIGFLDLCTLDVEGFLDRMEKAGSGISIDALTNKDLSRDLINKIVDIQDHYFISKNGSRPVNKNDIVTLEFYYPASIHSPIGGYEDIVNNAYSNYIWGFQKTDTGTYWTNNGYGISQGEILNICSRCYYSDNIYKVGLYYYKFGENIGSYTTINTDKNSIGICKVDFKVPFNCNFVWNEQERFDKVIDKDKLKALQNNVSNNNLGLQFGDSVLNLLKKVDKDGNVNGVPVLNDDGSLNQDIINNYYKYGDSKFTELPENYNIEITDNNNNDDVVVPDDNENNNFLTWVGSILDNIINFFKYCYNGMREIYISAKGIVEYCSLIFDILPAPLGSLMKLALIIMLLVCVVNFIRG